MAVDLRLVVVGWKLVESDLRLEQLDLRLEQLDLRLGQLDWRLAESDSKSGPLDLILVELGSIPFNDLIKIVNLRHMVAK